MGLQGEIWITRQRRAFLLAYCGAYAAGQVCGSRTAMAPDDLWVGIHDRAPDHHWGTHKPLLIRSGDA